MHLAKQAQCQRAKQRRQRLAVDGYRARRAEAAALQAQQEAAAAAASEQEVRNLAHVQWQDALLAHALSLIWSLLHMGGPV